MEFRLPETVVKVLHAVSHPLVGHWSAARVEQGLAALDTLPPKAIIRADYEIPWILGLHRRHSEPWLWRPGSQSIERDLAALKNVPGLAYLFLFHRDGRLREAALDTIDGGTRSSFFFAAVALRLNDWAAPVREAALRCANRCFPATSGRVIAGAAVLLLEHRRRWMRWTRIETAPLDAALARPDVVTGFVAILCETSTGAVGALLRSGLRGRALDGHLEQLATQARLPDVRAAALQALIERRVRWPSHREKRWIDKSMGRYRHDWVYEERPVESPISAETALALAARDRSALVRRRAIVALLTPGRVFTNSDAVITLLAADRNPALRERAAFARDMKKGAATGE